ncbi:Fructose-16-bisphosphatase [Dissostichus eleginoides]|uniref:Fructose-16-bisphosphatase n=1 Tax=Dissostichus eleginoides TaxID=100907 RepID=A0AAD9F7J9_DISEL|nr:Fructose-16-bisphosphatase [Dissostichus eleginoides]
MLFMSWRNKDIRDEQFSLEGIEELDNSAQETALHELDASMSSLDLNIGVISADEFNHIQNSTTGGALKTQICLNALPAISMKDSVYDSIDDTQYPTTTDTFPETAKILVEDDIIGHPASIVYHDSLHQLANYLVLPVNICTAKDPNTNVECRAPRPFEISVKSRGTAAIVEWMSLHGHTVWKWSSQPALKYGMLVGDFMLASNILLSGNNYGKISLLFRFMKMGMVERSSFFRIQDSYCVDSIKDFWNEKRAKLITHLHPKGPVVILGNAWMDSPGFCAQYCTYIAMDNDSKRIISMINIDKHISPLQHRELQRLRNPPLSGHLAWVQTLGQKGSDRRAAKGVLHTTDVEQGHMQTIMKTSLTCGLDSCTTSQKNIHGPLEPVTMAPCWRAERRSGSSRAPWHTRDLRI